MPTKEFYQAAPKSERCDKKNAFCVLSQRRYRRRRAAVEGPGAFISGPSCIDLCQSILDQEQRSSRGPFEIVFAYPCTRVSSEHFGRDTVIGKPQPSECSQSRFTTTTNAQ